MIDQLTVNAMNSVPADQFDSPPAVTRAARLDHGQKAAVLRAWSAAGRTAPAGDGSMPPAGLERARLHEIERALERLAELRRE